MKRTILVRLLCLPLIAATAAGVFTDTAAAPLLRSSSVAVAAMQANINVSGIYSVDRAPRGRTIQAAVVMEIPSGLHVNSNKPMNKLVRPTVLQVEAPNGIKVGSISYPRAAVRRFGFSKEQLAVFEGRTVIRFSLTVPANYGADFAPVRARLRYQPCTDEVCYPPTSREINMQIPVVNASESVRRINGQFFGGGRRKG